MNGGFMNNDSELNQINLNTAWASYKVNYCYGLPGINCFVRGIRLYVLPNGLYFYIAAKRSAFKSLYLDYNRIKSIEFPKGSGSDYHNIFLVNKFDTVIQITIIDGFNEQILCFEMAGSLGNDVGNQARRQELYMLLKNHGIFERFARPAQSVETAQRTPESREDVFAKIEQLSKLHQSGALTDEEFRRKKEELLKRI